MNEPFDVEISRALKESAGKSLEGWEFTPAMRSKVMDRIRSEADAAAPVSPPSGRFDLNRVVRPFAWVAVAAAAMVIAVNIDLPQMGSAKKEMEAKKPAAAPVAMSSAPAQEAATTDKSAIKPADTPVAAGGTMKTTGTPQQQNVGGEAATPDTLPPATPKARQVAFELVAPNADARVAESAMTFAAPVQGQPKMGIAAMSASNIGGAIPPGGEVLTLSPLGVKKVDVNNATVWERPLADLTQQSMLATGPDGRAAIANGSNLLYVVDAQGELARTIYGSAAIHLVAWSNDGRVASVEKNRVVVYGADSGKRLYTVEAGEAAQVAFANDGMLAVYAQPAADARMLTLVDPTGNVVAKAQPAVAGDGLVTAADGQVVVAGGQAYDRTGKALWQLPLKTEGLAALGSDRLVAWDAHNVLTVDARTGSQDGWKAEWKGNTAIRRVVPSPDGRFVAILAEAEDGALLWIVSRDGRPLLSEKLAQMPVDIGFAGAQVVLIQEGTVEHRVIPE